MEKINVDLIPNENDLKIIHASQNDTESRKFGFKLFSQEGYYDIPEITNIDLKYDTEAGGTETLLPINTSTPSTTPLNAIINGDEVYFNERVSVGNKQNIEKIKGNTLVFNQLCNDNFGKSLVNFTLNNHELTFDFTSTTNTNWWQYQIYSQLEYTAIANHKYYVKFLLKSDYAIGNIIFNGDRSVASDGTIDGYQKRYALFTNNTTATTRFYLRPLNTIAAETHYQNIKVKNIQIFDLTAMGIDNLTTSTQIEEWLSTHIGLLPYYDYNAGSLLSFNGTGIKTENASQTENNTLSLPVSTYFPTGMKSAGTVYDELTESKAITRIGMVDLGTLTWYVQSTYGFFTTGLSSVIKSPADNYTKANIICAIRETSTWTDLATSGTGTNYIAVSSGYLGIADNSGMTAVQFKQSLSGVYLYYELATPTEEEFTKGHLICSNGAEIALYEEDDMLICECEKSLTGESGTFDCKIRISNENEQISSNKFRLKVEERP